MPEPFRILLPEPVEKEIAQLDNSDKVMVEKILKQLYEEGDVVGKPLGLPFLREKKFGKKRLYYLIYEDWSVILIAAVSDKKAQEGTINRIAHETARYHQYVFDFLRKKGLI
ncbi:MAG: hypothetical protein V1702_00495 [Candidatus Woesearchaeota archaeon]